MSFELRQGNLFEQIDLDGLGQGTNLYGKMFAGIAAVFYKQYPEMFKEYKLGCDFRIFKPGDVHHYQDPTTGKHIFNMFSQDYPGPNAKIEWLRASLKEALALCETVGCLSLGCPMIGAGIGSLNPDDVLEVFKEAGEGSSVKLVVCVL